LPVLPAVRPIYDLVLLLDPAAPAEERTKTLEDLRAQVSAGGEIVLEQNWGDRALAYPIAHREQAEYHLLQLHADAPLIEAIDRNLRIADGVVRHRIIKLAPGTPAPPDHAPRAAAQAPPAPTPTAPAPAAEPEPEAVASA
jgi:small subunit ribosomal protein S6